MTTGAAARWLAAAGAVAALAAVAGCSPAPDPDIGRVDRVVVVSLPGVTWADARSTTMPNLAALADESAIGNLATRIGRRGADPAAAYLTAGAGTRADVSFG